MKHWSILAGLSVVTLLVAVVDNAYATGGPIPPQQTKYADHTLIILAMRIH